MNAVDRVLYFLRCTSEPVEVEVRLPLDKRRTDGCYDVAQLKICHRRLTNGTQPHSKSRTINWIQNGPLAAGDVVRKLDLDKQTAMWYNKRRHYVEYYRRNTRVVFSTETTIPQPDNFEPNIARAKYRFTTPLQQRGWNLDTTFVSTITKEANATEKLDRLFKSSDLWRDCDYVEFEAEYVGDIRDLDAAAVYGVVDHLHRATGW